MIMELASKHMMINRLFEELSRNERVFNISQSETEIGIVLIYDFFKDIHIEMDVRKAGDIAITRAAFELSKENGDYNDDIICKEIIKESKIGYTTINDKIVFQIVTSFGDKSDDDANETLEKDLSLLMVVLSDNIDKIAHSDELNPDVVKDIPQTEVYDEQENTPDISNNINQYEDYGNVPNAEPVYQTEGQYVNQPVYQQGVQQVYSYETPATETIPSEYQQQVYQEQPVNNNTYNGQNYEDISENNASDTVQYMEPQQEERKVDTSTRITRHKEKYMEDAVPEDDEDGSSQLNQMYRDIDKAFEKRKKEADSRERYLNQFSESLNEKEKQLEEEKNSIDIMLARRKVELEDEYTARREELEKEYTDKAALLEEEYENKVNEYNEKNEYAIEEIKSNRNKLEEEKEAFETEKKALEFSYKKLEVERENLEAGIRDYEEKVAIFKKLGKHPDAADDDISSEAVEKLKSENEALNKENDDLVERYNCIFDEKEQLNKRIEELYSIINEMKANHENEIQAFKSEIENARKKAKESHSSDYSDLTNRISTMQEELNRAYESCSSSNKINESLRQDYEKLMAEYNALTDQNKKYKQEYDDMKNRFIDVYNENEQLKASVNVNANTGTSSNISPNVLTSDMEQNGYEGTYLPAAPEPNNLKSESIQQKMIRIMYDLQKIGINPQPVVGEGAVLSAQANNCLMAINVSYDIVYAEKIVKKASKYYKMFEEWNQRDIRVSYLTNGNKIICKYATDDLCEAVKAIFQSFSSLD